MIYFDMALLHTLCKNTFLKDLVFFDRKISKNKNFEFQLSLQKNCIFSFCLDTSFSGNSHAGPSISFGLLGLYLGVKIYDKRHWDYEKNEWEEK